ncbi:hypothetical protein [Fluviispira sanaruensis]|uniref:hypothetical protein n=1 Tax=Fluviispira sanaruensis TaxID=2493639 RepID=UPI00102EB641|nr:hypothetical protein [Fluviispira sanaruensis]
MNKRKCASLFFLSLIPYSCSSDSTQFEHNEIIPCNTFTNRDSSILTPLESPIDILQGFNSYVHTVQGKCVQAEILNPKQINTSHVYRLENQSYKELLKTITSTLDSVLPIKIADSSIAIQFAKQSEAHSLSWNYTLVSEIRPESRKLDENHPKRLIKGLEKYFDKNGKLIDFYGFMDKCGNEFIIKQDLIAKLVITIKLDFDSLEDKIEFSKKVGSSISNLFGAENPKTISFAFNSQFLNKKMKKKTHISIDAIQFGGDPLKLTQILKSDVSCDINNMDKCDKTFSNLIEYLEDFKSQIDINNLNNLAVVNSEAKKYSKEKILNSSDHLLDFSILDHKNDELELINVFNDIKTYFNIEKYNRDLAIKYSDLAMSKPQENQLAEIINNTEANINILEGLSILAPESLKYTNLVRRAQLSANELKDINIIEAKEKLFDIKKSYKKYRKDYSTDILENFIIARGNFRPTSKKHIFNINFIQRIDRVSEDIAQFKVFFNKIDNENFKSFEFKFQTKEDINLNKAFVDIYCNIPNARDKLLFKNIRSGFNPHFTSFEGFKHSGCSTEYGFYVANPKGFENAEDVIIEMIGKI